MSPKKKNNKLIKDAFVQKILKIDSFKTQRFENFKFLKKPFFISIKTKNKVNEKTLQKNKITHKEKLVIYSRKITNGEVSKINCNFVKKIDKKQILKISLEKDSHSRFVKDRSLPLKFRTNFRFHWVNNFFKKQRGDYMIVAYKKKIITGFLLLIKENLNLRIDLIITKTRYQNQGIANAMISFANNYFFKSKFKNIIAGTQSSNYKAINFYMKNGFKIKKKQYIYHVFEK